jgi:hypothetical protein
VAALRLKLDYGFMDLRVKELVEEIEKGDSIGDENKASRVSGNGSETGVEVLPKIRIHKTYHKRKYRKMGKRRVKGSKTDKLQGGNSGTNSGQLETPYSLDGDI